MCIYIYIYIYFYLFIYFFGSRLPGLAGHRAAEEAAGPRAALAAEAGVLQRSEGDAAKGGRQCFSTTLFFEGLF